MLNGERGKKENNLAAISDQPGTCRKEGKNTKRKRERSLGEWCNFGSCAEASGKIIAAYGSPAGP